MRCSESDDNNESRGASLTKRRMNNAKKNTNEQS